MGGECFEDFQRLREDPGLSEMIGHAIPSPEAAWKFLDQFHAEEKIEETKRRRSGEEMAYIPEETEPLVGLGWVNRALVQELGRRCPDQRIATVEAVHDVLKNELAAGVMPSKYFGTNAAWLRLAVIAHNVMTALKRLALPAELLTARPKRLRFLIFNTPGRLVHHARRIVLRLATTAARLAEWLEAVKLLPVRV